MGFAYFNDPFDLLLNHFELFENFFVIQSPTSRFYPVL
jgi:hypothetical protein